MSKKLEVKITEERIGGKVENWYLMTKHGDNQFSGLPIYSPDEMMAIAKELINKAKELTEVCSTCFSTNISRDDTSYGIYYMCLDCKAMAE